MVFPVQNRTNKQYHPIQHIWIRLGTSFILKKQLLIFGPDLPKRGFSSSKQEKQTLPSNSAYCISLNTKFHLKRTILIFLMKYAQKRMSGHSCLDPCAVARLLTPKKFRHLPLAQLLQSNSPWTNAPSQTMPSMESTRTIDPRAFAPQTESFPLENYPKTNIHPPTEHLLPENCPSKILLKISVHGLSHLHNFPWTTILCTTTTPWNSFQDKLFPYFGPQTITFE